MNFLTLFEETVRNNADNPAIYWNDTHISYANFNRHVNQCAWALRQKGVTSNTLVGLVLKRSYEMLVCIFGVLKVGGAYLPIDFDAPLLRKQQIIDKSQLQYILVHHTEDTIVQAYPSVACIAFDELSSFPSHPVPVQIMPDDLAYVMFTSGSTGTPKGVCISHEALLNRILWMQEKFPIQAGDVLFQKTVYQFDVAVWEVLWWAMTGASVVLLPHGDEHDVILFSKMVKKYAITAIHFVPTVLKVFLEYISLGSHVEKLKTLKYVFSSGEVLDSTTVEQFFKLFDTNCQLVNLYGPTEATIDVTYHVCQPTLQYNEVPIGSAIHNIYLFVLNEAFREVEPGEVGELYISGVGVAKGYLNQPELTKIAFIPNPYLPGKVMYKTGDLVKYNTNNELVFMGRNDFQIKLRGIRIELGEIESHLKKCDLVKDVLVRCLQYKDLQILAAYVVLNVDRQEQNERILHDFLSTKLSKNMVPTKYFFLDAFPIKKNGKLDMTMLEELACK